MFSDRIVGCRTRRGLTQQELANLIGVHIRTVQNWEHPKSHPPTGEKLRKLAAVFDVPVAYLLDTSEAPHRQHQALAELQDSSDATSILHRCQRHFAEFLARCQLDPAKLHWTWIELLERFPLSKFGRATRAEHVLDQAVPYPPPSSGPNALIDAPTDPASAPPPSVPTPPGAKTAPPKRRPK